MPPTIRFTIARVPMMAVNMDVAIPIVSVVAKPLMGPVPNINNTMAAISVVTLESIIVDQAFS